MGFVKTITLDIGIEAVNRQTHNDERNDVEDSKKTPEDWHFSGWRLRGLLRRLPNGRLAKY